MRFWDDNNPPLNNESKFTLIVFLQVCAHETEMKMDRVWLSCVFYAQLSLCRCSKQRSILIPHHKRVPWVISLSLICFIKQRCLPITHAKNTKSLTAQHHNITLAAEIANICRIRSCSPQGWREILGLQVQSTRKQPAKQEHQITCQSISRESHAPCFCNCLIKFSERLFWTPLLNAGFKKKKKKVSPSMHKKNCN